MPKEQATQAEHKLEGDGLVVLCYHRVLPNTVLNWGRLVDPTESEFSLYTVSKEDFASQLDFLQEQGVRFLTPQEAEDYLVGKKHFSGKLALVTFDDGDLSLYKHAFPVLKDKQIPFLLFFIPGQANERWEGFTMCSWEQVMEMMDGGLCTVGLHTYDLHYYDPVAVMPVFNHPEKAILFEEDTKKGIELLEKKLGTEVKWCAYPYGFGTSRTNEIIISHGIPNNFTLSAKVNRPGSSRSFIGRVMVTAQSWPKVEGWVLEHHNKGAVQNSM
ncbi:polysaccharide deacetylase family protein [Desulfofalx alkaliphila]|uniref:polysaccharide deacetylase family protein n=1 Tax=Desulfofalx alkaliphila TaxID=105483 RepID=UPI00146FAA70|nr:polysaccharide deacetylase family protein [Desulfofalx alkaliphila]